MVDNIDITANLNRVSYAYEDRHSKRDCWIKVLEETRLVSEKRSAEERGWASSSTVDEKAHRENENEIIAWLTPSKVLVYQIFFSYVSQFVQPLFLVIN